MANKVLTIKMDENDIERIRQYYETLVDLGIISTEKIKFNGLLKHLLLDNLEYDMITMLNVYSECAMEPKFMNPSAIDGKNGFKLCNIYNFDDEAFDAYKECCKSELSKGIEKLEKSAQALMKITGAALIVEGGDFFGIDIVSDENDRCKKFWINRVCERMKYLEDEEKNNSIEQDIGLINQSDLSEEVKTKIIEQINQYDKDKKNNFNILNGAGHAKKRVGN